MLQCDCEVAKPVEELATTVCVDVVKLTERFRRLSKTAHLGSQM